MNVRQAIAARLEAAVPLVSSRIYPLLVPQGKELPALTYQVIDSTSPQQFSGSTNLDNPRIQINSWARTLTEATQVAQQVRDALDGHIDATMGATFLNEGDLPPAEDRRGIHQDFSIWFERG